MRRQDILSRIVPSFDRAHEPARDASSPHPKQSTKAQAQRFWGGGHLLADEKYVDGAKIENIEEGQGGQPIICGMLACIQLHRGLAVVVKRFQEMADLP